MPSPIFFFNGTSAPEFYTLSLHDALPISVVRSSCSLDSPSAMKCPWPSISPGITSRPFASITRVRDVTSRSQEHTSELQSRPHLVCRLLLEKKKNITAHRQHLRYPLPRYQ